MLRFRRLYARLQALWQWRRREADLHEEIAFHLSEEADDRTAAGTPAAEARAAAVRDFGNVALAREDTRRVWGWTWAEQLLQDIRYAARVLGRQPGVTALAILAVALGVGATTAVFTIVDAVLLRPLPYADASRLVVAMHGPSATSPVSPADYLDYRAEARSFERLSAAQARAATLGGDARPERIIGLQVAADLFDVLGVPPLLGRTFIEGDDQPGRDRIVVLSHGLWQRRFGGDPGTIGRPILLDGEPHVVVGVMPPHFWFAPFWVTHAEIWTPLSLAERLGDRDGRSLRLFGRLAAGVTREQAQAEMSGIAARLEQAYPSTNTNLGITVRPLLDITVANIRPTLLTLMAMVTFVLLLACANVANALLARAAGRQREIALRFAIGASRGRLVRQLLTESLVLSTLGAVAGVAVAYWGVEWLLATLPPGSLPRQQDVGFDGRVLSMAAGATLLTGVATGLAPAWQLLKERQAAAVRDGGTGVTDGPGRTRMRGVLVSAEVTLAIVLLAGAGLMGRTMLALSTIDPGFQADRVAVATVSLAGTPHAAGTARYGMFQRVRDRLATMPGVTAVGAINHLPLAGDMWTLGYTVEGQPIPDPGQRWQAVYRIVEPGYLSAMGLPLLMGRDLAHTDTASAPPVVVVNQAMAERRWPGENPIGRRIRLPGVSEVQAFITIVGVASNARQHDWTGAPDDEVYLALSQRVTEFGLDSLTFVLRTDGDAGAVAGSIARDVAAVDRGLTVSGETTMSRVVADELWRERLTATLSGLFAAVALGLAAIGVYAVVAYAVMRRTREFGVRVALGATAGHVQWLALSEVLRPVTIGAGVGLAGAMVCAQLVQTLLYAVTAQDPLALGGALLVLLVVAIAAAWLPARRASRMPAVRALKQP